ncbi:hypothetical protein DL764_004820 [Monosporascus ibericus]|uniref:Zn(2)-C6 fungal-type domain-containing protein n=1 Tax=Monosporascus ibericus TaxID=155417 RepID=A0A4Q4TE07_9PEZI|nr:hypothetical protein DL764_004820 [Monosporascus ibericus]
MEPIFVIQRQRKFHRRSKRGCLICSYCLKHGAECRYSDSDATPSPIGTPRHTDSGSDVGEPSASLLDPSRKDQFTGTSFKLPDRSRDLFNLFARLHFREGRPRNTIRLQTIRFVNEQIKDPVTATHDGTVAAVATLALVENALGSTDTVASHLRGLAKIKQLQEPVRRPTRMGLVQRMILMAARTVTRRSVRDIVEINRTDSVHQSLVISLLRATLRPIYSVFTLSSSCDWGESLPEVPAKKTPRSKEEDSNIVTPLRPVDCSRSGFMACYFYLYVILREERVDSFILNWFIEQLLIDVHRTELLMQMGQYSQSLWFWSIMFGACITTAGKTDSSLEDAQMKLARDEYLDKINMASQVLRIKTWEDAKAVLRLFAWEDEFDGELELKAIWEESVWAHQGRAKRPGAGNVDLRDVRAFW